MKKQFKQKIRSNVISPKGGFYLYKNYTSFLEEQLRQINQKRILANSPIINKTGRLWSFE